MRGGTLFSAVSPAFITCLVRSGLNENHGILRHGCLHPKPQEHVNVILFGKRVFADVIQDLEMRSSWFIWVGLKSSDKCPYKRHTERDTEKRRPCEDRGRDWSNVAPKPRKACSHRKLGRRKQGSSRRACGGRLTPPSC